VSSERQQFPWEVFDNARSVARFSNEDEARAYAQHLSGGRVFAWPITLHYPCDPNRFRVERQKEGL
jgi:hypothetical protein